MPGCRAPVVSHRIVALLFILSAVAWSTAQAVNENETVGFQTNHLFESGAFGENIDILNGGLNLSMPLGPRYQVSRNLGYQLTLAYGSKIWKPVPVSQTSWLQRRSPFGVGFGLHFGRIYRDVEDVSGPAPDTCRWVYVSPDGNEHEIPVQAFGMDPCSKVPDQYTDTTDQTYTKFSVYSGNLAAWSGTGTAPTLRITSADSKLSYTFAHFVQARSPGPSGTIRYLNAPTPAETSISPHPLETSYNRDFGGWYVTRIEEQLSSGAHFVEVRYHDDPTKPQYHHLIKSIRDTLGRVITFEEECEAVAGACKSIDMGALNEGRRVSARVKSITMPAFKPSTLVEDAEADPDPDPEFSTSTFDFTYDYVDVNNMHPPASCPNPEDCFKATVTRLTSVLYPTSMTEPRPSMRFEYELPSVTTGEVHRRILPTGGAITYWYGSYGYLSGNTRQVIRKTVAENDTVGAPYVDTFYARQAIDGGTTYSNPKYVTVTDGNENDTKYYYRGSYGDPTPPDPPPSVPDFEDGYTPEWDDGVNERIEYYEGTGATRLLLRAETRDYDSDRVSVGGPHTANNTRMYRQATIHHDDGDRMYVVQNQDWNGRGLWRRTIESGDDVGGSRWTVKHYADGAADPDRYYYYEVSDGAKVLSRSDYNYDTHGNKTLSIERLTLPVVIMTPPSGTSTDGDVVTNMVYDMNENLTDKIIRNTVGGAPKVHIKYGYQPGGFLVTKQFVQDLGTGALYSWKAIDRERDGNTGLVFTTRDSAGVTTDYTYDGLGRVTLVDPAGIEEATEVSYPTMNSTAVRQGSGSTFDCDNQASGNFVLSCYGYDGYGRLISTKKRMTASDPEPARQTVQYDLSGSVIFRSEWFWDGEAAVGTIYDYGDPATYGGQGSRPKDPFGRVRTVVTADDKRTETTYFGTSSLVTLRDVAGPGGTLMNSTTVYNRDVWGRLLSVLADGDSGADAYYAYDLRDKLHEAALYSPTSGLTQTRRFEYDAIGRLHASEFPEGGTELFENYDVLGNPLKRIDGSGNATLTTYDPAGRPVSVSWQAYQPAGSPAPPVLCVQTNTYDSASAGASGGRLTSTVSCDEDGEVVHTRNLFYQDLDLPGRLSKEQNVFADWQGAPAAEVAYNYNSLGQVSRITYPEGPTGALGAFKVEYVYSNGLPTLAREVDRAQPASCPNGETNCSGDLVAVAYESDGSLTSLTAAPTRPQPSVNFIGKDNRNRPTNIKLCRDTGAACDDVMDGQYSAFNTGAYAYDGAGNIAGIGVNLYEYDHQARLIKAAVTDAGTSHTQTFQYDPFGNMTEKVLLNGAGGELAHDLYTVTDQTTGWNTNRILSHQVGGNLYVLKYDTRGNLIRDAMRAFEVDGLNRVTAIRPIVNGVGKELVRYSYEGNGNRISKDDLTYKLRTYYVRDSSGRLLSEFRRTANATHAPEWVNHQVYLGARLVALRENALPPSPGGLVGTAAIVGTQGVITLSWKSNPTHQGSTTSTYAVYRSPNTTPPTWALQTTTSGVTYQQNVTKGTWYKYVITAKDPSQRESYSSDVLVIRAAAFNAYPGVPVNLLATPSDTRVNLTWDRNPSTDKVVGYHVYRGVGAAAVRLTTIPLAHPSFLDQNLTNGASYTYSVSAVNTTALESPRSPELSTIPNDYAPPGAPLHLDAAAACDGASTVSLAWSMSSPGTGVVSYYLFREPVFSGANSLNLGLVSNYLDSDTDPDALYTYWLKSVDAIGNLSAESQHVRIRTSVPLGTLEAPAPPFAKSGDGVVTLRIPSPPPSASVESIRIYRKQNVDVGCEQYELVGVAQPAGTYIQVVDGAATNDVAYDYAVSYVVDVDGSQSDLSVPALATPVGAPWSLSACVEDYGPPVPGSSNWKDGTGVCDSGTDAVRRLSLRWQDPVGRKYQPLEASNATDTLGYLTGYRVYQHLNQYGFSNGYDVATMFPVAVDYEKKFCESHPDQSCYVDLNCPAGDTCQARSSGTCEDDGSSSCSRMQSCDQDYNAQCLWKPGYCYQGPQTQCTVNADCTNPMKCVDGACVCETDADCSSLLSVCRDRACVTAGAGTTRCMVDGDCGSGYRCGRSEGDPYLVSYQDGGVNAFPDWGTYYTSTCYAVKATHKVFANGQWINVESEFSDNFDAESPNKFDRCLVDTGDPCGSAAWEIPCAPQGQEPPIIEKPLVSSGVGSVTVSWEPPSSCEPDVACYSNGYCDPGQFCLYDSSEVTTGQCRYEQYHPCATGAACATGEVCLARDDEIDGYFVYSSEPYGSFSSKFVENRRYHTYAPFPVARVDKELTSVTFTDLAPIRQQASGLPPSYLPTNMSFRVASYDRGGRISRLSEPSVITSPQAGGGIPAPGSLKHAVWFTYDPLYGRDGVKLAWLPGAEYSGLSGYRVWRSESETEPFCALIPVVDAGTGERSIECKEAGELGATEVSVVPAGAGIGASAYAPGSFIDSSGEPGVPYFYKVTAVAGGESGYSPTITAKLFPRVENPLSPPSNFKAEAPRGVSQFNGDSEWQKIHLTWCQNPPQEGVTAYNVYRSAVSMGPYTDSELIGTVPAICMDGRTRCQIAAGGVVTQFPTCTGGQTTNCCSHFVSAPGAGSCKVVDMTVNQSTDLVQPIYYYVVTAVRTTAGGTEESPFSPENQGRPNYPTCQAAGCPEFRTDVDNPPDMPCSMDMSRAAPGSLEPLASVGEGSGEESEQGTQLAPYRLIGEIIGSTPVAVPRYIFYHQDHLGTTRAITDELGNLVSRHHYLPFGEEVPSRYQEATNTRQFTGHERDKESGLDYMMARYYSSSLGRFMAVDPAADSVEIEDSQSWNRYTYVGNNPLRYFDPSGELKFESNQAQQTYFETREYLVQSPAGADLVNSLESLSGAAEPTLVLNSKRNDSYNRVTNTINWDPTSPLDVHGQGGQPDSQGGALQSPALGLAHEADHAVQANTNPEQYSADRGTSDPDYSNKEEKRVVEGSEKKIANDLDEPTRHTHGGDVSPTSKTPTSK